MEDDVEDYIFEKYMANISLNDEIYDELLPYIKNEKLTDINWNGKDLWVNDQNKGRYKVDTQLSEQFISQFSQRIANLMNASFNKYTPLLEAETDELRISIIHESVAPTGRSISIRKTPAVIRVNKQSMIETNYCPLYINDFLENCVKTHMNIVFVGLPGTGKTELLKGLTTYIPDNERVITIEDNLEIRYRRIHPEKDCVELKVDNDFNYEKAIKSCLRQLPDWIVLSEARSTEVKYLLESMSTGTHCLTTLHTDNVTKIPDRIKNMMPIGTSLTSIENDIYSFIDVGVLIRSYIKETGIERKIAQVCVFNRDELEDQNTIHKVYEIGTKIDKATLPHNIMHKFELANISNPFVIEKNNDRGSIEEIISRRLSMENK